MKKSGLDILLICVLSILTSTVAANYAPRPHVDQTIYDQRLPGQLVMVGDEKKIVWYNNADDGEWYWFSIRASNDMVSDVNYVWPVADGDPNSVLATDGAGILFWGAFDANSIIYDSNDGFQLPDKTPGSVMFANTDGFPLWEDNPHLFYDDANDYFGVGLNTPNNTIQVLDLINFYDSNETTMVGRDTNQGDIGTGNSFFGYKAGERNTIGSGTEYLGHVIVNNTYVDMLDTDFALVEQRTYTGGTASAQCVTMTNDGQMAVGHVLGIDYWDADGNRDNTWFVPDGGWTLMDLVGSVRFTSDDAYLFAIQYRLTGFTALYKFEVSTGDEVFGIYPFGGHWESMTLDSSDNVYAATSTDVRKYSTTDGSLLATYTDMDNVGHDIIIDEDNDRIYAVGYGTFADHYQIAASDWSTPGNYAGWTLGDWTKWLSGVTYDSDGNVYAVGSRTQNGVGGAWASVYKFDSDLTLIDSYDTGGNVVYCWWDGDGNLVVRAIAATNELYVLNTDLELQETYSYTDTAYRWSEGMRWQQTYNFKGSYNTYAGDYTGYGDSGGNEAYYSSAGGYKSNYSNSSGYSNAFWGALTAYDLTTGYELAALGRSALENATTANRGLAAGPYAGANITTASRFALLGPFAGSRQTTTDGVFAVDAYDRYSAANEQSKSILFGHIDSDEANQWLNINADVNLPIINLSDLTASRIVATDASKTLASVTDLTSWIAGTANEIDVSDDGDGTLTIGIIDPLKHEKGGVEADISGYGGLVGINGGTTLDVDELSELLTAMSDVTKFFTDDDIVGPATDPDIDASGELGIDTDGANEPNDVILRTADTGGDTQYALANVIRSIQGTIIKPQDLDNSTRDAYPIWENSTGMSFVITKIRMWSDTDDTTLNVETYDSDWDNNATVDAIEIATDGTANFYTEETTITAATITNGSLIVLDFDDTDAPGWVKYNIMGYFNADVD